MTVLLAVSGVLLASAAALLIFRALAGPSSLDRLVAMDCVLALTLCGIAVWAVYSRDTSIVPALVAFSLVGFISSVSIARFRVRDE
ncbi:monovalent cation/H+ antiporter subunit F [Rhodococcus ruber Chol-4]|uniref:Putative monovalent cation/H+ antiporter subunit F n=1 Tax=Rhodococcus ruber TaxID=1830 RepID=A0A098BJ53_9NOCA|nr:MULTISPECIES: monovalent cation/H+ antiporter complex subunit F [Rhodococcus]MDO2379859.1 monovalent cation/H+ antiporter complex subunit F [Rhodococcus ruber]ATQ28940.1 cation:proton antiporter [Rhodococcus ruber]AUM17971.1 cation:proton antiporter [Rhodococcus ruber]KXF83862.1 monovalent cation/H+ antiporter subunit F [Rhodococcus ruber Chol-4]MBD8053067.1 cation:proton antiporter [Rhodococcus ruber]